jgi:hypothetical protein
VIFSSLALRSAFVLLNLLNDISIASLLPSVSVYLMPEFPSFGALCPADVTRESLRLIPPLHSAVKVTTQDDEVPTLPSARKELLLSSKGTFVHPMEAFNLDKTVRGEDAWEFKYVCRPLFL